MIVAMMTPRTTTLPRATVVCVRHVLAAFHLMRDRVAERPWTPFPVAPDLAVLRTKKSTRQSLALDPDTISPWSRVSRFWVSCLRGCLRYVTVRLDGLRVRANSVQILRAGGARYPRYNINPLHSWGDSRSPINAPRRLQRFQGNLYNSRWKKNAFQNIQRRKIRTDSMI